MEVVKNYAWVVVSSTEIRTLERAYLVGIIRCPKGAGYMARIQGEFWARKTYFVSFTYR